MHSVIKQKDSIQTYRLFQLIFPKIQLRYEKIRIMLKRFRYLMYVYEKILICPNFTLHISLRTHLSAYQTKV